MRRRADPPARTAIAARARIVATAPPIEVPPGAPGPVAASVGGRVTVGAGVPVPPGTELIYSFYCDHDADHWLNWLFITIEEDGTQHGVPDEDIAGFQPTLIRDPTDRTANGWSRFYCRLRSPVPPACPAASRRA